MYLRHYDESSACVTARQHKVAGYRLERTLMGCHVRQEDLVGSAESSKHTDKQLCATVHVRTHTGVELASVSCQR